MKRIIKRNQKFAHSTMPVDEAKAFFGEQEQSYKVELIDDLERDAQVESVSIYQNGDFIDLCEGPHVASTGAVGAFKLLRTAGAYWRGDENRRQLQRVYGTAWETREELDAYLNFLEEAERRLIVTALRETGGNVSEAARRLGVSRMVLRYRIRKLGLDPGRARADRMPRDT